MTPDGGITLAPYFASFRVGSHCDGVSGGKPYARNNARVRVIVRD
jgi:hypothetical protein